MVVVVVQRCNQQLSAASRYHWHIERVSHFPHRSAAAGASTAVLSQFLFSVWLTTLRVQAHCSRPRGKCAASILSEPTHRCNAHASPFSTPYFPHALLSPLSPPPPRPMPPTPARLCCFLDPPLIPPHALTLAYNTLLPSPFPLPSTSPPPPRLCCSRPRRSRW